MTTTAIQSIESRVRDMVGKSFLVNTITHKISNFRIADEKLLIVTDKRFFEVDLVNAPKTLEMFLETEDEHLPVQTFEVKALGSAGEIKDIIMENIRKLKGNPEYIPQAQAINESVKVLVDVAKTEVLMLDLMHKIKS